MRTVKEEPGERIQWDYIHVDVPTWGYAAPSEEYNNLSFVKYLQELGWEGWEIVSVIPIKMSRNIIKDNDYEIGTLRYIFKRQCYYQDVLYE